MTTCNKEHRYVEAFEALPYDQGGMGRHKCAGCAYEQGVSAGLSLSDSINIPLNSLPNSQAGAVRHRSPHAAFALGYLDGVNQHYENKG